MKTLIVCGSRYGSTRVIAQWIAERLGFVRIPLSMPVSCMER